MSMIKGKNTKPEIIVRKYLFHCGFRFRVNTIRKKSLKISMATFFKGKALENGESEEKIEKRIYKGKR